uniref:Uncharacterized protein n=1 Tax=Chenopodium quinoa TaxID=63459 RepID=A0A803KRM9_CHEQI
VTTPPSRSDSTESSQSEEDTARDQEKNKHVVEWTEYDEKNLMNLGSSEIERNKRLESLIAKRRARKMFSMQPRRHNFYSFDQHDQLDQQVMGSIFDSKGGIEFDDKGDDYHQPGSAPSLRSTRNPFDFPYDPHEEKPVLTGVNERARLDATKNEAFRNSVRKVLTCLAAFPRNKDLLQQSNLQDLLACNTNGPNDVIPSKMQERSFYTEPHHHKSNFSIASDMQVEVSEGGSPPMTANEANSPTDQDSYDGDDDKDINSIDDEELWGISPHPTKRGEFGMNFKLKDTLKEEEKVYNRPLNLCNVDNVQINENDDPFPTISMSREEEEGGDDDDQEATVGGVVSSLSPRSILPNEGKKKLIVDLQSTNGDILDSSSSSSSEGLTSQMLSKVDHLAEYLANLPPSECGSNFLEDVERSSHVRERKTEETFHNEINQIFEFDENKEDSKEGSQRSIEDSTTTTSQIEEPKETSATSNEFHANDLKKEHVDQNSSTTEQNDYFRRIEDKGERLATNENEVNSRPELKESISDSNSTTCQEDLLDQLRLEDNMKVTPLHQVQDEHKDESLSNQIICDVDESTSQEKANEDRYDIDLK